VIWILTKLNRCRSVEILKTSSKLRLGSYLGIGVGGVDAMKENPIKECLHQKTGYCPCGGLYGGGVNTSQSSVENLGTCMPMLREKSKWKFH
jgi:hypothetical protein